MLAMFNVDLLLFLHPCTHRRVTLCPCVIRSVRVSVWGSLSLALETHARQTATKESPGRNTRPHRWQKVLGGGYVSLYFVTHRWHWKRVPGQAISATSSFFYYRREKKCPRPRYSSPIFVYSQVAKDPREQRMYS